MILTIDGLPGTGKSTMLGNVHQHLLKQGFTVRAFSETAPDHILHPVPTHDTHGAAWGDLHLRMSADEFAQVSLGRWRHLVQAVTADDVVLLESFPFQSAIRVLIQLGAPSEYVADYWSEWCQIVENKIAIVYLKVHDFDKHMNRTFETRGQNWETPVREEIAKTPFAKQRNLDTQSALIELLREQNAMALGFLAGTTIPHCLSDIDGVDYAAITQKACDWLERQCRLARRS
jgi:thymidylate kinase